jgi:hypothetical protein
MQTKQISDRSESISNGQCYGKSRHISFEGIQAGMIYRSIYSYPAGQPTGRHMMVQVGW